MRFAEIDMTEKRAQRRRIIVTAIAVGAIAVGFYIATFIRFS